MKISRLQSYWIIFLSSMATLNICIQAITLGLLGKITRAWVDKTTVRWARKILRLVGVSCRVINPHQVRPIKNEVTIIMCNHSSLYDIPISYEAFSDCSIRMLAKKELSRVPFFGKAMKASEYPFIDRKNRAQAILDLAYAKKLMHDGIVLWLCPEGTRSKDGKLAPFKKGGFITAIETKAKIIPMAIRGAFDILPAGSMRFNMNREAEIHIGKPIDASEYTLEEKNILLDIVYQEMKKLAGETTSNAATAVKQTEAIELA